VGMLGHSAARASDGMELLAPGSVIVYARSLYMLCACSHGDLSPHVGSVPPLWAP
jgi:hypothetical protein